MDGSDLYGKRVATCTSRPTRSRPVSVKGACPNEVCVLGDWYPVGVDRSRNRHTHVTSSHRSVGLSLPSSAWRPTTSSKRSLKSATVERYSSRLSGGETRNGSSTQL